LVERETWWFSESEVFVCMCVCVCEKEREREMGERKTDKNTEREMNYLSPCGVRGGGEGPSQQAGLYRPPTPPPAAQIRSKQFGIKEREKHNRT
jgi:hypothetical protein